MCNLTIEKLQEAIDLMLDTAPATPKISRIRVNHNGLRYLQNKLPQITDPTNIPFYNGIPVIIDNTLPDGKCKIEEESEHEC